MFLWSFLNLCVANCTTDVFFHIDFFLHTLQVLGQSKGEVCNFSIHFLKVRTTKFMTGFRNCNNPCAISTWWETNPPMNHECKKFLFLQQPYLLAGTQSSTKSSCVDLRLLLYNSCKMAAAPDLDNHKSKKTCVIFRNWRHSCSFLDNDSQNWKCRNNMFEDGTKYH